MYIGLNRYRTEEIAKCAFTVTQHEMKCSSTVCSVSLSLGRKLVHRDSTSCIIVASQ